MNKLTFFTKPELMGVTIILLSLGLITSFNLSLSLRRARDAQRRADINVLVDALNTYSTEFSFVPQSEDGAIKACKSERFDSEITAVKETLPFNTSAFLALLEACPWGTASLSDVLDPNHTPYLARIPQDPKANEGLQYLYLSNGRFFQFYAFLEGESAEDGYREGIVNRGLSCGDKICNFGKAPEGVPLEKSIEEYELELLELEQQRKNPL